MLTNFDEPGAALKQQAKVRIGICIFMGIYFSLTEFLAHPLFLSFIAYSLAALAITWKEKPLRLGPVFVFLTLSSDVAFTIISLHIVGSYGYFLFLILIQICFGYGVRYGSSILWVSTLLACFGILTLYFSSDYWMTRPFELISFFAGVPFLSIYIQFLNRQLEVAKKQSDIQALTNARLLKFVSHDIRTQLQALLGTSEGILMESPNPNAVRQVFRMREIIQSLARIATNFVQEQPDNIGCNERTELRSQNEQYILSEWIGKVCSRFSRQVFKNRTRFKISFPESLPINVSLDFYSLERLLLNSLSNAVRFSRNGTIEIEIDFSSKKSNQGFIVFRIRNTCPDGFSRIASSDSGFISQRLLFGSGLGHTVSKAVASEAGGSFSAKAIGPGTFLCKIQMPCSLHSVLMLEPMAYPALYFSKSTEIYNQIGELLSSTCCLYQSSRPLNSSLGIDQNSNNASSFLFDESMDEMLRDHQLDTDDYTPSRAKCHVRVVDDFVDIRHCNSMTFEALATPTYYSLNNAVAFAAAFNQKDQKLNDILFSEKSSAISLSGLYVEDSDFNANYILAAAQREGWTLDHANRVTQALGMLGSNCYDFIILDWELEEDTALDFLDAYRQLQSTSTCVCIVILSAHERARIHQSLGAHKVNLILEKPISAGELLSSITMFFRPPHSKLEKIKARCNYLPRDLFDRGNYQHISDRPAQRKTELHLLDGLVCEIDILLEGLNRCWGKTEVECRRTVHKLIGVADAGGVRLLADRARVLLAELDEFCDCTEQDLIQINAVWLATVGHIRAFQMTLS